MVKGCGCLGKYGKMDGEMGLCVNGRTFDHTWTNSDWLDSYYIHKEHT